MFHVLSDVIDGNVLKLFHDIMNNKQFLYFPFGVPNFSVIIIQYFSYFTFFYTVEVYHYQATKALSNWLRNHNATLRSNGLNHGCNWTVNLCFRSFTAVSGGRCSRNLPCVS